MILNILVDSNIDDLLVLKDARPDKMQKIKPTVHRKREYVGLQYGNKLE